MLESHHHFIAIPFCWNLQNRCLVLIFRAFVSLRIQKKGIVNFDICRYQPITVFRVTSTESNWKQRVQRIWWILFLSQNEIFQHRRICIGRNVVNKKLIRMYYKEWKCPINTVPFSSSQMFKLEQLTDNYKIGFWCLFASTFSTTVKWCNIKTGPK